MQVKSCMEAWWICSWDNDATFPTFPGHQSVFFSPTDSEEGPRVWCLEVGRCLECGMVLLHGLFYMIPNVSSISFFVLHTRYTIIFRYPCINTDTLEISPTITVH
jgi:hypothetical protein